MTQKLPKNDIYDLKWAKNDINDLKWPKNGPKMTLMT